MRRVNIQEEVWRSAAEDTTREAAEVRAVGRVKMGCHAASCNPVPPHALLCNLRIPYTPVHSVHPMRLAPIMWVFSSLVRAVYSFIWM